MSDTTDITEGWQRYGTALLRSMAEVREESAEDVHPLLLETADYWLSLGLAIGISDTAAAARLLDIIERDAAERDELHEDGRHFVHDALG